MKLRNQFSWLIFFFLLLLHACAAGQAKQETAQQDTVCITRTGKKYHECTCGYLWSSSTPITLKNAIARGYTACSVCAPPTGGTVSEATETDEKIETKSEAKPEVKPVPKTSATSRQCMAYTKSGLRCKRTTTSASGKCWQHE